MNNKGDLNTPKKNNHSFSNPQKNIGSRATKVGTRNAKKSIGNTLTNAGTKIAKKVNPVAGAAINAGKKVLENKKLNNQLNNSLVKKNNGLIRNNSFGKGLLAKATGKQMSNNNKEKDKDGQEQTSSNISSSTEVGSLAKKVLVTIIMAIMAILQIILIAIAILAPLIILIAAIVAIITVITALFGNGGSNSSGYATYGYYDIQCNDVTVIFTDKKNNYEVTGSGTYQLEEYVAGVIAGEVGEFNNLEVYKEYAIAARTYLLKNETNCTIESSDRRQVFKETSNSLAIQAAEETKGQVLLDENGRLMLTEYDAFCSIDIDDEYYTIKQKNQRIPIEWVESQSGILQEWKQGTCAGNHGRGSSQWGSYYLATERNYDYKQLLNYYYGGVISNKSFMSSVAGLDIKDTKNASYELNQPIENFLSSKGSSLEEYNSFIKQNVESAGVGTREGVVTAAVSMINYLYDNFDTKLPYYWGGSSQDIGIPSSFGKNIPSSPSENGNIYYYKSFDCSGFTSWAVRNGGYKISRLDVTGFDNLVGEKNMCDITDSSCKGQPGDFISYKKQHIKMIVSVDETNNIYYVAESTTSGIIIQKQEMHSGGSVKTSILHMDDFYNNKNNVDPNY